MLSSNERAVVTGPLATERLKPITRYLLHQETRDMRPQGLKSRARLRDSHCLRRAILMHARVQQWARSGLEMIRNGCDRERFWPSRVACRTISHLDHSLCHLWRPPDHPRLLYILRLSISSRRAPIIPQSLSYTAAHTLKPSRHDANAGAPAIPWLCGCQSCTLRSWCLRFDAGCLSSHRMSVPSNKQYMILPTFTRIGSKGKPISTSHFPFPT